MEVCFLGSPDMRVYGVERWRAGEKEQGVLYVAGIGETEVSQGPVLIVESSKISSIIRKMRDIITKDYRANDALARMNQAVLTGRPIKDIVELCREVVNYPVFILNKNLSVTAECGGQEARAFLPFILDEQNVGMKEERAAIRIPPGRNCPYEAILKAIYHKKELTGYLLVVLKGKKGQEDDEEITGYLDMLGEVLANRKEFRDSRIRVSDKQKFLSELLEDRTVHKGKEVERRKKELGFPGYDKYYLLSISVANVNDTNHIRRTLEAILHEDVYEYQHYFIAVVGCGVRGEINSGTYPKLTEFLSKDNRYAGLSNGFLDFSLLHIAFEQSVAAISIRKKVSVKEIHFCKYNDVMLTHLLLMAQQNGIPYETFCHPNLIYIEKYDEEHETEYLKTLLTYVLNDAKLAETANKLYIHRNTLYHRIATLKEEFGINFNEPRELMKLWISCTAYGAWGRVERADKLFGPLS